ncbi:hypothetical protein ACFE04_021879 [Oxalis oulophora]
MDVSINLKRGFWFAPTDYELVSHYLRNYLSSERNSLPEGLKKIIQSGVDVYSMEPWLLDLNPNGSVPYLRKHHGYFFVKREKIARKDGGTRPKRTLHVDDTRDLPGGFWRSSATRKPVCDFRTGEIVGRCNSLCFYQFTSKERIRKEAIKTHYLMNEFEIIADGDADGDSFNQLVICHIKYNGKDPPLPAPTPVLNVPPVNHHRQQNNFGNVVREHQILSTGDVNFADHHRNKRARLTEINQVQQTNSLQTPQLEENQQTCFTNDHMINRNQQVEVLQTAPVFENQETPPLIEETQEICFTCDYVQEVEFLETPQVVGNHQETLTETLQVCGNTQENCSTETYEGNRSQEDNQENWFAETCRQANEIEESNSNPEAEFLETPQAIEDQETLPETLPTVCGNQDNCSKETYNEGNGSQVDNNAGVIEFLRNQKNWFVKTCQLANENQESNFTETPQAIEDQETLPETIPAVCGNQDNCSKETYNEGNGSQEDKNVDVIKFLRNQKNWFAETCRLA